MNKSKIIFWGIFLTLSASALMAIIYYPYYKAKAAVRNNLIDPESAQFDGLFTNKKTGAVCGYVNAKNKMGGYTGKKIFIVYSGGTVDFDESTIDEKLKRLDAKEKFTNPILAKCYEE